MREARRSATAAEPSLPLDYFARQTREMALQPRRGGRGSSAAYYVV